MRLSGDEGQLVGAPRTIFDEEVFKHTITKERKRAERSGLVMGLLLIGIEDSPLENRGGAVCPDCRCVIGY